jgi:hypothetical protein
MPGSFHLPALAPLPPPLPHSAPNRRAFSSSRPHHPALVIPPAALQADLTTDDATPPPLAPGQIPLAPTQVPLPPSPVDTRRIVEPKAMMNGHTPSHGPQFLSADSPKQVLEAIEEAASSTLPIPMQPPVPPPPGTLLPQPAHQPTAAPLRPLANGTNLPVHSTHSNVHNGKHVTAKGRIVNPIFVKGTPTHPILNGVPSTPVPTCTEFAVPPPLPLPALAKGNGPKPMAVQGPLIGNLLLSSCPGKKGALGYINVCTCGANVVY